MKKLVKITKNQIVEKGVQSLADRPNASAQYGVGGLSPSQLKIWFDKLATFLAEKINELYDTISADDAAEYIRIALDDYGVDSLGALVEAMSNGDFANKILQVFPSANSFATVPLQKYINDAAQAIIGNAEGIEELDKNKLDKVTSVGSYRRAYMIDADGTQKTIYISDAPLTGAIPVFVGEGQINVAVPTESTHAANKGYVDQQDLTLGSTVDISIDKRTYIMTLRLKNSAGAVLSTAEVDFPLESVVVSGEYHDGILTLRLVEGDPIDVDISHIVNGLVNSSTYEAGIEAINQRIDKANKEHAAQISVSMDSEYRLAIILKNSAGAVLSEGMVDLPIESLITGATYKDKVLTLKLQSGDVLDINISDIVSGLVPTTRKINGQELTEDITITTDVKFEDLTEEQIEMLRPKEITNLELPQQWSDINEAYEAIGEDGHKLLGGLLYKDFDGKIKVYPLSPAYGVRYDECGKKLASVVVYNTAQQIMAKPATDGRHTVCLRQLDEFFGGGSTSDLAKGEKAYSLQKIPPVDLTRPVNERKCYVFCRDSQNHFAAKCYSEPPHPDELSERDSAGRLRANAPDSGSDNAYADFVVNVDYLNRILNNGVRLEIADLTRRLNALANSDDTTLDQLSEIVAYIKSNKSLIDGITTSKVSVSDIINDLTSTVTNKPLSAAQGGVLKGLIDALQIIVNGKAPAYTYGTADIEAGSASTEPNGTLHLVYE